MTRTGQAVGVGLAVDGTLQASRGIDAGLIRAVRTRHALPWGRSVVGGACGAQARRVVVVGDLRIVAHCASGLPGLRRNCYSCAGRALRSVGVTKAPRRTVGAEFVADVAAKFAGGAGFAAVVCLCKEFTDHTVAGGGCCEARGATRAVAADSGAECVGEFSRRAQCAFGSEMRGKRSRFTLDTAGVVVVVDASTGAG